MALQKRQHNPLILIILLALLLHQKPHPRLPHLRRGVATAKELVRVRVRLAIVLVWALGVEGDDGAVGGGAGGQGGVGEEGEGGVGDSEGEGWAGG